MNFRSSKLSIAALMTAAFLTPAFGDVVISYQGTGTPVNTSGPFVGASTATGNQPNRVAAGVVAGVSDPTNAGFGELVGDVHGRNYLIYPGLNATTDSYLTNQTVRGGALGAINPTSYFSWGWTSSPSVNLTQLTLGYGSDSGGFWGAYGARQLQLAVRVNGGAFQTIFSDNDVNITSSTVTAGVDTVGSKPVESHVISLAQFTGVTSAEFRLYGIDTNSGGFHFFNVLNDAFGKSAIRVEGTFLTPEPATGALFAGAGLLLALAARSRRRNNNAV